VTGAAAVCRAVLCLRWGFTLFSSSLTEILMAEGFSTSGTELATLLQSTSLAFPARGMPRSSSLTIKNYTYLEFTFSKTVPKIYWIFNSEISLNKRQKYPHIGKKIPSFFYCKLKIDMFS